MIFFKKVVSVSSITLVSRILGMVRDVLIAYFFGASLASDAFFIAFRPFDLARKMMADGILTISFIPVFSRVLAKDGKDQAVSMFLSSCLLVFIFALLLVILGFYFAPSVLGVLAPGYVKGSHSQTLSVILLKMMLPYMGVICLTALSMGVLHSMGNFLVPAVTPILLNLSVIAGTLAFVDISSPQAAILAAGVTIGGLVQLGFQIPWLSRKGLFDLKRFVFVHPGVIQTIKTLVPSMVGAAAFQINMLTAGLFASKLVPGSVSYLYYAERLVQFPLALFAASVATVLLPVVSGQAAIDKTAGNMDGVRTVFNTGARLVFFITIPAMAGIMALNRPIVDLLFSRGAFDPAAAAQTADCLFWLAAGLWAMAGTRLFATFHFALGNIRLPFFAGLVAIGFNLVFVLVLGRTFGVAGLAFAVALSSMAGFLFLVLFSRVGIGIRPLAVCACRALFISGIMTILVRWLWEGWMIWMPGAGAVQGLGLMVVVAGGVLFFFAGAVLFAGREINMIKTVIFGKI